MAPKNGPRTMAALANVEPKVRSDFAVFCMGVDHLCAQLSLIISTFADDLFRQLANGGGKGNYMARSKAWRATRPLRVLAAAINGIGKGANRCYRIYAKMYADEITPERRQTRFDHTK